MQQQQKEVSARCCWARRCTAPIRRAAKSSRRSSKATGPGRERTARKNPRRDRPDQTGHWFVHMRARLRSHADAPAAAHFPLWVATRLARLTCQSSERSERGGHLAWPLDTAADGVTRLLAPATMRCYGHNVVQCSLHCLRTYSGLLSSLSDTTRRKHCNSELRLVPHVCKVTKPCPPLHSYSEFEEEHEQQRGVPCTVHLSITRAQLVVGIATSQQRFSAWSASHLFIDDIYYCNIYMCIKTPTIRSIIAPN